MAINSTYARGAKAWGICQRCGLRALLNDLVFDGYYRDLRVHPECRDDRHPQERPPTIKDPVTLWKPSPEQPGIPPVLSAALVRPGAVVLTGQNLGDFNRLTWTASVPFLNDLAGYRLYLSDNTLITDTGNPDDLTTDHVGLEPGDYTYYVVAYDTENNVSAHSNEVTLTVSGTFDADVFVTISNLANSGVSVGNDFTRSVPSDQEFMVDPLYTNWINAADFPDIILIHSDGGFYEFDCGDAANWTPTSGGSFPKPAFSVCVYKSDVLISIDTSKLTITGRGGAGGDSFGPTGGPAIAIIDMTGGGLVNVDVEIANQIDADQGIIAGGIASASSGEAVVRYGCTGTTTILSGGAGITGVVQ